MQQYRKCCTHPIGVSVYKWVSERGSRSAAADVAFQRELVEFIRRKICSPCHAGSSESRTVNRSALMEIMEVLAFILRAIEPIGAPSVPFQNLQSQQGS